MIFRRVIALVVLLALGLLAPGTARSVVSQIDGTIVPINPPLVEGAINPNETTPIDAIADAYTFPQIFLPPPADGGGHRYVTFTDIQELAGFENSFGWYNVGDPSRLFRIFSCYPVNNEPNDQVIVDFAVQEGNGNWDGGFIAFYIITPEGRPGGTRNCGDWEPMLAGGLTNWLGHIYFTESEQNGDGDYVHNLVYSSKDDPNRFYFAFEDLFRGGDNDFTDFTIMVEGLTPPCVPEPEVCDGQDNDCDGEIDEAPTTDEGGNCGIDTGECEFGVETCSGGALVCTGGRGPAPEVCDGKDNDCDGTADNNLTDTGQVCGSGVGECVPGTTVCTSGALECSGETGPVPEVCDGKDNNCNTQPDEGLGQTTCGLGICVHTIDNCVAGVPQTCDPLEGAQPEGCNGLDDNCDGVVDGLTQLCYPYASGCTDQGGGVWSCAGTCTTGLQECPVGGTGVWGSCLFAQGPQPEVCDNADNNCDGQIDEGLTLTCYPLGYGPGTGCTGPGVCLGVCREGSRTCALGAWGACLNAVTPTPEQCNNADDDCDGDIDEGLTQACQQSNGFGTCTGTQVCASGAWGTCSAATPAAETCNNVDDDCDGAIDENVSQACYTGPVSTAGVGACRAGTQVCTAGSWGACQGEVTPTAEVCDGVDNDCDGFVDEDVNGLPLTGSCYSGAPSTEGVGPCHAGTRVCAGGAWGPCQSEVVPSTEQCNNVDDNCNGQVDENLGQTTCGLGICGHTVDNCVNGVPQTCDPYAGAQVETCDGLDNDCDGVVDGLVQTCYGFGAGCTDQGGGTWACAGTCSTGIQVCATGGTGAWGECLFDVGPGAEVCDGQDNDCDGLVDEDAQGNPLAQACYPPGSGANTGCVETSPGVWDCEGTCRAGQRTCQGAAWSGCQGDVTPAVETCDGTDNDCDGEIDEPEDIPGLDQPCSTALGRCTPGILRCVNGQELCEGGAGPFPGECNGLDDDCDGEIDEPDEVSHLEGQPCGDATGMCEPGLSQCVGGQIQCVGGVLPGEEVCDGQDNDCDGQVDNQAECPPQFWCVQGDCRKQCDPASEFPCPGSLTCQQVEVDGQVENVCLPAVGTCAGQTCPDGWICQNDQCVDPCDPNPCAAWQECNRGSCVDVSCTGLGGGCDPGEFCVDHACQPDPCDAAGCDPETQYCVRSCDGTACTATCEALCLCRGDERCDAAGQCVPDLCFGVDCGAGQRCRPGDGTCEADPCFGQLCGGGQACFEGTCIEDPCASLVCPIFFQCVVSADANGDPAPGCQANSAFWVPGSPVSDYLATGGGGCQCDAAGGPTGGIPVGLGWLLGLGLIWRRRRRQRPAGARAGRGRSATARPRALLLPLVLLTALAGGCALDPYTTGEPGRWNRDGGGDGGGDARVDAEADACVAATELCDGQDNDCDGVVDNGFDLQTDRFHCGDCGNVCDLPFAEVACVDATCVVEFCLPGHQDVNGDPGDGCEYACFETNAGVESCDGVDNNCDGVVDEGFDLQNDPQNCGQCHRTCAFFQGVGACVQGQCQLDSCRGGFVDKDGNPNNGCECMLDLAEGSVPCVEGQPGACGAGEVCADVTGDGSSFCAVVPPDLCDGVDNDCDGQIDEDAQLPTGDCYTQPVGCTETAPGAFDCEGTCQAGQPSCVGGNETCVGQVGPAAEVCDGADNDCNGVVDDGFDLQNDPANCGGCGVRCNTLVPNAVPQCVAGQCRVLVCLPGFWDVNTLPGDGCEYACSLTNGGVERCGDGVDNDCDGLPDEGFDFTTDPANCGSCGNDCNQGKPFGTAVTGCAASQCTYQCLAGYWDLNGDLALGQGGNGCEYACSVTGGGTETCDGVDNNCDGQVDEGFAKQTDVDHCGGCNQRCADQVGDHAQVTGCANGVCQFTCLAGYVDLNGDLALGQGGNGCECLRTNGGVEICDGVDNDCDGQTDEDVGGAPLSRSCYSGPGGTAGVGPCREGTQTCAAAAWGACQGEVLPQTEVCDGADNDCDGELDEASPGVALSRACYTGPAGTENVGPCLGGAQSCTLGAWGACLGETIPQIEQCNGQDDDCDGAADEDFDTTNDLANCNQCGYSCVAHAGAFSIATACTGGVCQYTCLSNHWDLNLDRQTGDLGDGCEYACIPTNGGVEKCGDGLDNDCNNQIDEGFDFTSDVQSCGACGYRCADHAPAHAVATGCVASTCQFGCVAGWWDLDGDLSLGQGGNGCEYGCTFVGPETCNGDDDDCNGTVDDSPTDVGQQCGVTDVGPCAYGLTVCGGGVLSCAGNIDPEPELCDGVDNDCDGTVDLTSCLSAGVTDVRLDNTTANSIQLDMDARGQLIHAVWLDTSGGDADIHHNCSSNGGTSWNGVWGIYTGGSDAVKPRVKLDPSGSGRVYVVWEQFNGGNREIYFTTAPSCGGAWAAATRLDTDASDSLNIDLAADGAGRVAVVWEDFDEGATIDDSVRNIWLRASNDSGASFAAARRVNDREVETQSFATAARVAYGASGRIFVTWVDRVVGGGDIFVRGTDDRGATWAVPSTGLDTDGAGNAVSKFPRIIGQAGGRVFVVWQDLRNNTSDIFLNFTEDNGVSWLSSDVQLDDDGAPHDSFEASLAFGRAGYVHVVWRDFRAGLPTVRVVTSDDWGLTWGASVVASQGSGYVSEPQVAADGAGKVFAAWVDDRDGLRDVYLNYALDDGATFQPADLRLDTDLPVGSHDSFGVRLAAGAAGAGDVVWIDTRRDSVNGDIRFNAAR